MERKEYFGVVSRNVTRARVRLGPERGRAHAGSEDVLRDQKGSIIAEPSDGELIPQVPYDVLLPQRSLPVLGPTWNSNGNPNTPRRDPQAATPAEPDPKVAKTRVTDTEREDWAFTQRHAMGVPASQICNGFPGRTAFGGRGSRPWMADTLGDVSNRKSCSGYSRYNIHFQKIP